MEQRPSLPPCESLAWRIFFATLTTPPLLLLHAIAFAIFSFIAIRIVPHYEMVYAQEDRSLPIVTVQALKISDSFTDYWYLFALIFLFGDGATLFLLRVLPGSFRLWRPWAFATVLMLFILSIGWLLLGASLPMLANDLQFKSPPTNDY